MAFLANSICSLLTPAGRGAVAVVGLHGPDVESVLNAQFRPVGNSSYSTTASRNVVYGIWIPTHEDVVVVRCGDDRFEVHCHGGNVASDQIIKSLESANIENVPSEEFGLRFDGIWKVEVEMALAKSTTDRTAKILLRQMDKLPDAVERIQEMMESGMVKPAIRELDSILAWSEFGQFLSEPRTVVLCGNPNVGKSSLINALVGFHRTIVHDMPGTTRDVVTQRTAFDGWPVELIDTAGLRENTASPVEAIGVERAREKIESAQFKIAVFDASSPWTRSDTDLISSVEPDLIVYNKIDLILDSTDANEGRPAGMRTSVKSNEGITELIEAVGTGLVTSLPDPDQPIPVCHAQTSRLRDLRRRS